MNIKIRLSLQFTGIVLLILLLFASFVYYFSHNSQLDRYRDNLLKSAKNSAILLIDVSEVDSTLLKKIQRETILLDDEEIAITNDSGKLIYSNNIKYLSGSLLNTYASKSDSGFFAFAEKDGVYYKHQFRNHDYHVLVMATDNNRRENLSDLKRILFWSVFLSLFASIIMSYLFSRNAIRPISKIIREVKLINSSKLSQRLRTGKGNDEIVQLIRTFNDMLANLEVAFNHQRDFVSNASHELRTPLSVMILEADYVLNSPKNAEEYRKHVAMLVEDLKTLNQQVNSLLELAQVNKDHPIPLSDVRIDEIVFEAIHQLKTKHPSRKIITRIQYPENAGLLVFSGNVGLLKIAFRNLLDNACKFSENDVLVDFILEPGQLHIEVSDQGIGIPSQEINNIFKPFSRASNVKYKSGFGIGLSLVEKIFDLHGIRINVKSTIGVGTTFILSFVRST